MVSEGERPMTAKEFGEFVGVSKWSARKMLRDGLVQGAYSLGGRWFVDMDDARRFKNMQRKEGATPNHPKPRQTTPNNAEQH